MLVPLNPVGAVPLHYAPLEDQPGLHRVLANTELSESGILRFANQYGPLGFNRHEVAVTDLMNVHGRLSLDADSFEDRKSEIVGLRDAIAEWDDSRKKASEITNLETVRAALAPRLELLKAVALVNDGGTGFRIGVKPPNLGAAVWLQFVRETEGSFDLLQCPECGRWFKCFPEQIKTPRVFCSQACRSKVYRRRQEEARALGGKGITIEHIARA
jgi:hypothetical protein